MLEMYDFGPEISHKSMNLTDIFSSSSFCNVLVNNVPFYAVYTNLELQASILRHAQTCPHSAKNKGFEP